MTSISLDEAKRDIASFLRKVEAGEAFVILQGDKPVAELRPASAGPAGPRPFGLCAGEFRVPDDFDAPLPEETLSGFEGA
jgi:antitoxin (DNA-binding transcriptional repressor) of toxin-antitoxin stability system